MKEPVSIVEPVLDWPDDVEHEIVVTGLREEFRRFPCPWWRVEGVRVVGRIGPQIVEAYELAVSKAMHPPREVAQVRGVLAERVIISTPLDPYLGLKALVQYSGFSRRTLLNFIAASDNVLPHYRVNATGKVVVRRSDYDSWIAQFRRTQSAMDELIDERRRARAARRLTRVAG